MSPESAPPVPLVVIGPPAARSCVFSVWLDRVGHQRDRLTESPGRTAAPARRSRRRRLAPLARRVRRATGVRGDVVVGLDVSTLPIQDDRPAAHRPAPPIGASTTLPTHGTVVAVGVVLATRLEVGEVGADRLGRCRPTWRRSCSPAPAARRERDDVATDGADRAGRRVGATRVTSVFESPWLVGLPPHAPAMFITWAPTATGAVTMLLETTPPSSSVLLSPPAETDLVLRCSRRGDAAPRVGEPLSTSTTASGTGSTMLPLPVASLPEVPSISPPEATFSCCCTWRSGYRPTRRRCRSRRRHRRPGRR